MTWWLISSYLQCTVIIFLYMKEHMDLFLFQHALYGCSHESGNFVAMAPGLSIRCTLGREMRSLFFLYELNHLLPAAEKTLKENNMEFLDWTEIGNSHWRQSLTFF